MGKSGKIMMILKMGEFIPHKGIDGKDGYTEDSLSDGVYD